jgi:hypothetical protein
MGRYSKGILGSFTGKIGTVIGSTWKGISYMRSLPKPSTKAPSDAQMEQRIKLALAVNFLKPAKAIINVGFKSQAVGNTSFNVATSLLVKQAFSGTYPDFEIDYSKVVFSSGELIGPWNAALASTTAATVNVSWTNNTGAMANATDKAVLIVFNEAKGQCVTTMDGAARSVSLSNLSVPGSFSGDEVQVWMAFISNDGKLISSSVYVGSVEVA